MSGTRLLACLIIAPQRGYDEPGILSYAISSFCPTSADGLQRSASCWKACAASTALLSCAARKGSIRTSTTVGRRSSWRRARNVAAALIVGAHTEAQVLANVSSMQATIPPEFWAELKRQNFIEQNAPTPTAAW